MQDFLTRKKQATLLKQICKDIDCSGMSPDMCQNHPEKCKIIQNYIKFCEKSNEKDKLQVRT